MTHNDMSGIVVGSLLQARDVTLRPTPAMPHALDGLPARVSTFTGRMDDLAALYRTLAPGGRSRVSVVSGLPGVGKTELVLQAAEHAHRSGWCPGGVLLVDLHGYDEEPRTANSALLSLLTALGVPADQIPPGSTEDRARLYASLLATQAKAGKPVLVILDNANSSDQVRPLIPPDGTTPALVTSRHRLTDLDAQLHDLAVLPTEDCANLLDRILRQRHAQDDRVTADPTAASRIATQCGGLPLAIQIAGALLADDRSRPAGSLASDLSEGPIDELHRERQGVRRAFDLSYRHLSAEQRRVFRLLTANPGPDFSLDIAAPLVGTNHRKTRWALESLARAHLLEPGSTHGRWRMHDLVRTYAEEHGQAEAEGDNRTAAMDRLLQELLRKVEAVEASLASREPDETVFASRSEAADWLEAERENLVAGTELAARSEQHTTAVRLSAALSYCLVFSSHPRSRYQAAEAGLVSAKALGDYYVQGYLHRHAGAALRRTGDLSAAMLALLCSFGAYGEIRDRRGQALALDSLGELSVITQQFDQAIHLHTSAIAVFQEVGDQVHEGLAWANLGVALHRTRRCDRAIAAYERALELCQATGDWKAESKVLDVLGECLLMSGQAAKAVEFYTRAAALLPEGQTTKEEFFVSQGNLAYGLVAVGETEHAVTLHEQCVAHWAAAGDQERERTARLACGVALWRCGRFEEAITMLRTTAEQSEHAGDTLRQGSCWLAIGDSLTKLCRHDEAHGAYATATRIYRDRLDPYYEAMALTKQADALHKLDQYEDGLTAAARAVDLFTVAGGPRDNQIALRLRGIAQYELGRYEEARDSWAQEIVHSKEEGDQLAEAWALGRLAFALDALDQPDQARRALEDRAALLAALDHPGD